MKIINGLENKIEINSLEKWFELCPPQKKEAQWKDNYSAKEMAKFWLNQDKRNDFLEFIRQSIPEFTVENIIPEYASRFDSFHSPRMHDLFIEEKSNKAIITVEGKVNETFGNSYFGDYFVEAINQKKENNNSNLLDRLINLYQNYFDKKNLFFNVMYQLLTWYAGSLTDAIKADTNNFIMVMQEFKNKETSSELAAKNLSDFGGFVSVISEFKNEVTFMKNRQIIGPISNIYTNNKNLYVGYYSTDLEVQ